MTSENDKQVHELPSFSISDWGLFPSSSGQTNVKSILRWWFIRYNPLYFFSAMFILTGVVFVAGETGGDQLAELGLFAVIQVYEWMLIGGAAFLINGIKQIRPAILLILLELVFLLDCTFRLETLVSHGFNGMIVSISWAFLSGCKVYVILKIFKVANGALASSVSMIAALGIVLMLQLLANHQLDELSVIQASGGLGILLIAVLLKFQPPFISELIESPHEQLFAQRLSMTMLVILSGFYFYHLLSYSFWMFSEPILALLVNASNLMFMIAIFSADKNRIFKYALGAYLMSLANPYSFFIINILCVGLFCYCAFKRRMPDLSIAAAVCCYFALWSMGVPYTELGEWPGLLDPPTLTLAGLLGLIAWKLKLLLAWALLGGGALVALFTLDWSWLHRLWLWLKSFLPDTRLGIGLSFLFFGFLSLFLGLALNWWFRKQPLDDDN